jgi:hypothetical protein
LDNFFKLDALWRKGLFPGRKKNGSTNHAPLGRRVLNYLGEQFPFGRKGLSCKRKGLYPGRKQNGSTNHAPLGRRGLNYLGEQLPSRKKRLNGKCLL